MSTNIAYVGRSYTDRSVTFGVDGDRYEYFFATWEVCSQIQYMAYRWPKKALARAKLKATHWEKHIERV